MFTLKKVFKEFLSTRENYRWAKHLAQIEKLQHANFTLRRGKGENLYASFGKRPSSAAVVKAWYDENKLYDYNEPGYKVKTGIIVIEFFKSKY